MKSESNINISNNKTFNQKLPHQNIVYIGSDAINKANAIKTICQARKLNKTPQVRLVNSNDGSSPVKPIEFGEVTLDSGEQLHLIKIDHVFQMNLIKRHWQHKSLGVILLVDLNNQNPLAIMQDQLKEFSTYLKGLSLSIGVINKKGQYDSKSIVEVNQSLAKANYKVAVFDIEPNNSDQVSLLVQSMLITHLYGSTGQLG